MEGKERLYYALGELAYAVAKSDGQVQKEERQKIHEIVMEQTSHHNIAFDLSEIIFHILQRDHLDSKLAYDWAIKEMKLNGNHFTEDMKVDFIAIIEKVARAFNPVTKDERELIEKFRKEVELI